MRILASLSNEMNMQETYRKGKDLYSTMAAEASNEGRYSSNIIEKTR